MDTVGNRGRKEEWELSLEQGIPEHVCMRVWQGVDGAKVQI